MDEPVGYSIPDAGKNLGNLSRASIYRAVERGDLELIRIGGRSMITRRSIEALLSQKGSA